jgi:hypothetical protein
MIAPLLFVFTGAELKAVRLLGDDDADALYAYMMNIVSDVKNKTESATDHRIAGLTLIRKQIASKAIASAAASTKPVSLPVGCARLFICSRCSYCMSFYPTEISPSIMHARLCEQPTFAEGFLVASPPIAHVVVHGDTECRVPKAAEIKDMDLGYKPFPSPPTMLRSLYDILSSVRVPAGEECTVRLCVQ